MSILTLAEMIGKALAAPIRRSRIRRRQTFIAELKQQGIFLGMAYHEAEWIMFGNNL